MTYASRIQAVLDGLGTAGPKSAAPEALLVSALPNIRYLSGFTGSNALLLLTGGGATLFTDPRYTLQAADEVSCAVRIVNGPLPAALARYLSRYPVKRLGFERNRISFETHEALRSALPAAAKLIPVASAVEDLRMVKSPAEIDKLRQSAETNSRAFRRALKAFRPGMRETELAAEIDHQQRRAGAESSAFETIVAAGSHSALPHARPSKRKIAKGSMLLVDMGAFEEGYASDMTRTFYVGTAGRKFRKLYAAVQEAQRAAVDAVRPGVPAHAVDSAARKVLARSGFGPAFVHSTGHGLGLEIHEEPRIGKRSKTILKAGFAVTIEPGAYLEGYGGVRIEDTVIVTEKGCELLTGPSKELVEL